MKEVKEEAVYHPESKYEKLFQAHLLKEYALDIFDYEDEQTSLKMLNR